MADEYDVIYITYHVIMKIFIGLIPLNLLLVQSSHVNILVKG